MAVLAFTACSKEESADNPLGVDMEEGTGEIRDNTPRVVIPEASGVTVHTGTAANIDLSNTASGYIMVQYTGSKEKIKVQVRHEGGEPYTYDLKSTGEFEVFPLTAGDGNYTVTVNENISGQQYAIVDTAAFTVALSSPQEPFLYPNQYVNFTAESNIVDKGSEIAEGATSELQVVTKVYNYVTENVEYDYDKAENVETFYLPEVDNTLETGKGICFDYASLMTGMLRSQGIPTQLVIGYAGTAYHAWISVYTPETGWIDNMIQFDGKNWIILDPTFASTGDGNPEVTSYIGDGKNYNALFFY